MVADEMIMVDKYLTAVKNQEKLEDDLDRVFSEINPDNQIFGLRTQEMKDFAGFMLTEYIGQSNFDWVEWYQYECDYGTKNSLVVIDGVEQHINNVKDLVNICFEAQP